MSNKATQGLSVQARVESLTALTAFVVKQASACGVTDELMAKIELVVEEIFINQVRHAYQGQGGDVEVGCFVDEDAFCVRFTDWGPPFDPRKQPPPDTNAPLEERRPGGLGIYLVRNLAGRFDYRREGDRNVVTACFELPAPGREETSC